MKLLRAILYSASFFASCAVIGYSLGYVARVEAEGNVWAAYHAKEAERWKAIQRSIELDTKRTNVETELRRLVIAEFRKCRRGQCK